MKKFICHFFALLLICTVFSSVVFPASAAEARASREAPKLPFTMKPNVNITSLWTTNRSSGGNSFTYADVERLGSTVTISGSFKHSSSSGSCKSGICYYSGGSYQADGSTTRNVGYSFNNWNGSPAGLIRLSDINYDITYYGFVKNNIGSGYVYDADITIGIS